MRELSTEYREGEVYFRLTFPDIRLLYPQVETFVFVGKNLSDEDTEDTSRIKGSELLKSTPSRL